MCYYSHVSLRLSSVSELKSFCMCFFFPWSIAVWLQSINIYSHNESHWEENTSITHKKKKLWKNMYQMNCTKLFSQWRKKWVDTHNRRRRRKQNTHTHTQRRHGNGEEKKINIEWIMVLARAIRAWNLQTKQRTIFAFHPLATTSTHTKVREEEIDKRQRITH